MPVEITMLLLCAAAMHAVWNGMIKGAKDAVVMASWVYCGSAVLLAPLLPFAPTMPAKGWAILAIHFALHMVYKYLLVRMYQVGDFSRVFPIARGSAPALVTLAAIPIAGELPPPVAIVGVGVICLGLVTFAAEPGAFKKASLPSFILAGAAGLVVSAYTIVDALGVRLEGAGLTYFLMLFVGDGIGMALLGFAWRGRELWPAMKPHWKLGLSGSVLSISNFAIVLWVVTFTPIGLVAAVRETSIVIAALIGVVFFKEAFGPRRLLAASIIVIGVAMLNLAGS